MKKKIHPKVFKAQVTCVCGNAFETASVKESIKVEICSNCHPFYTGQQKIIDTAGRVDRFRKKYAGFIKKSKPVKKDINEAGNTGNLDQEK